MAKPINLLFVRSTESPGRPQRQIAEAVYAALLADPRFAVKVLHSPTMGQNPKSGGANFYDPNSTKLHLVSFLNGLTGALASGVNFDAVFFIDLGSPEITLFDYLWRLRFAKEAQPKLFGIFHSSTRIDHDLFNDSGIQRYLEIGVLDSVEQAFVATTYAHDQLLNNAWNLAKRSDAQSLANNITVSSLPLPADLPQTHPGSMLGSFCRLTAQGKVLTLAWNHRMSVDKGFNQFIDFAEYFARWAKTHHDITVRVRIYSTIPEKDSVLNLAMPRSVLQSCALEYIYSADRASYLAALKADCLYMSFAKLETFGYSLLEAASVGAQILAPDNRVYWELYEPQYLYSEDALDGSPEYRHAVLSEAVMHLVERQNKAWVSNRESAILSPLRKSAHAAMLAAPTTIVEGIAQAMR